MKYSIVVPIYKSSNTIPILNEELITTMNKTGEAYEIIYVDDCSPDNSWEVLKGLNREKGNLKLLRLGNNVGQWMATLAGTSRSTGERIITIDDDLEYVTEDIIKLIEYYNNNDVYLVYGIPREKKNKNLSYKLFFLLRDRFLRFFFSKIKTESFKMFDRKIYFNNEGETISNLHFEAYTKFTVSPKYTVHVDVEYRKRYEGNSTHTLWMKIKILDRYGIEYFKSPFKYLLYLIVMIGICDFTFAYFDLPRVLSSFLSFITYISIAVIVGILGKYLSGIYFQSKKLPEYIIIEEI